MFAEKGLQFVDKFFTDVRSGWNFNEGRRLAELLVLEGIYARHRPSSTKETSLALLQQLEALSVDGNAVDEMALLFLKSQLQLNSDNVIDCFYTHVACLQVFLKQMQSHKDNWALPVMARLVTNTRTLSFRCADDSHSEQKDKVLEKAADVLMHCFRICCNDTRSELRDTKRRGMLHIVNQLFKIYFRMNNTKLCRPLIRAIEGSNLKNDYSKDQLVTYKFFLGRIQLLEGDIQEAQSSLLFAFNHRHPSCYENTRRVLNYLVPLRMLHGIMPSRYTIRKYNLGVYGILADAIKTGNLSSLREIIERNQLRFVSMGIFVVMEKLTLLAYRNLFKKIYSIMQQSHQLNVNVFYEALKFCGHDDDLEMDETEFIVANLISRGYIKGYISHQHSTLVVSKQNPFPSLTTIRP